MKCFIVWLVFHLLKIPFLAAEAPPLAFLALPLLISSLLRLLALGVGLGSTLKFSNCWSDKITRMTTSIRVTMQMFMKYKRKYEEMNHERQSYRQNNLYYRQHIDKQNIHWKSCFSCLSVWLNDGKLTGILVARHIYFAEYCVCYLKVRCYTFVGLSVLTYFDVDSLLTYVKYGKTLALNNLLYNNILTFSIYFTYSLK